MKTHLHLITHDIAASVSFYRTLLAAAPNKHYDDYALFLTDDPGLELALSLSPQPKVSTDAHYGIAVDSPELVDCALKRLRKAGLAVDVESDETCCYAKQNKVWATDPDGRRWETYFVIAETKVRDGENMTCCQESDEVSASCC